MVDESQGTLGFLIPHFTSDQRLWETRLWGGEGVRGGKDETLLFCFKQAFFWFQDDAARFMRISPQTLFFCCLRPSCVTCGVRWGQEFGEETE